MEAAGTAGRQPAAAHARWLRPILVAGLTWVVGWSVLGLVLVPTLAADSTASVNMGPADWVVPAANLTVAIFGALVLVRDRTHPYGWLLFLTGIVKSAEAGGGAYALYALAVTPDTILPLAMFSAWLQDAVTIPSMVLIVLVLPATFPDGRAVAGRWGRALHVVLGSWVGLWLAFAVAVRPLSNWLWDVPEAPANPTGILALPFSLVDAWWMLTMVASVVVSIGSIVVRWRRAGTELRQQMKWPLLGFVLLAAVALANVVDTALVEQLGIDLGVTGPVGLGMAATTLVFAVGLGLGVLKFRLYDVDRVINRTIVYALLTVVVVAVYVLGVVGVGRLVPGASEQGLALGTTVLVAVAFDPVRRRVQSAANRWMFGQRDDPYAVLSHLGGVMAEAGTPGETLQSVVDTVARSLKLPWVAVELDQREGAAVRVVHGAHDPPAEPESQPLVHRDDVVGRLLAAPRSANEPLSPADRRLLADVARQAGAVAATARLTEDLQRSREELVLAREDERRRIRRDLHDGLGPTLAAQTLALDAAADRVLDDPAVARDLLLGLKHETQDLVAEIRRLVHELRPPALDELGLAGALVAQVTRVDGAGQMAVRIRTQPDPLPELPAAVEVATWRIAREAMANVLRHADATTCTITLTAHHDALEVRVVDDGIGLPVVPRAGVGLASMRERAEELGGTFHATDRDGGGSEVVAMLPTATAVHAIAGPVATTAMTLTRP